MPDIISETKRYNNPEDFSNAEIIALSGVLGIHNNLKDANLNLKIEIERKSDYIRLYITSVEIKELFVLIYPCNKVIHNESFIKQTTRTGLAFEWVSTQVSFATLFPFKKLKGSAHRNDGDKKTKWKGYFIWPKFGYVMEEEEENALKRQLNRDLRNEKNLQELFLTDDGIEYWIKTGDTWKCLFDLDQNSTSRNILKKYKPSGKKHLI